MSVLEGLKVPLLVSSGACLVGGAIIGGLLTKKAAAAALPAAPVDTCPEKWIKVGEITELWLFPVKSLQGISVQQAKLGVMGLKDVSGNPLLRDRVFLIVDEKGMAMTQKKLPMLALMKVKAEGIKLHLSLEKDGAIDHISFDVPIDGASSGDTKVVIVMGENVKGVVDCGDDVAAWLDRISGSSGLRLVYHVEETSQRGSVKRNSKFHTYRESHTAAFHDETSYLLMTEESLAHLNKHLGEKPPVSHKNFRPSLIINGVPEPFSEDFWGYVRLGDKDSGPVLKSSVPCQRCLRTTVNPETGKFRDDGEPLSTLYKLKRPVGDEKISKLVTKSAILGSHFGLFEGEDTVISVGDKIYAALA